MAGASPWRPAPAVSVAFRWPFSTRWGLDAALGSWTLGSGDGSPQARSELSVMLAPSFTAVLSERVGLRIAAGPALLWRGEAMGSSGVGWGAALAPDLLLGTRRRSIVLGLGPRLWVTSEGSRFGVIGGISYVFH